MKKFTLILFLTACVVVITLDQDLKAAGNENPKSISKKSETYQDMANRVFEIRSMDRSTMSIEEKQGLKSELKMIKRALRDNADAQASRDSGGIYISVGALIIIIILLIILL
jgi:hypothetical protein